MKPSFHSLSNGSYSKYTKHVLLYELLLFGLWGYWRCGHSWPIVSALGIVKMMIVEKQMECRLAGETKVLGENLPQRHFCPSQNPTWPDPGLNPDRRGGKPATNRLGYGAAFSYINISTAKTPTSYTFTLAMIESNLYN
jgi:hypothetical protein